MKIIVRIAGYNDAKPPEKKRAERLAKAFLCGVASTYDWSGNAGRMFVDDLNRSMRDTIGDKR